MNKIKQLEVKKLLKELDFIESDFNYKNEIVSSADNDFIKRVNELLDEHKELKIIFDEIMDKKIDFIFNKKLQEIEEIKSEEIMEELSEEIILDNPNPKVKKLYREIAKVTHPDKTINKKLNEFYIKATNCYTTNDIAGIYAICDELDIEYEIDEEDNIIINEKINKLKERILFMESTMTWQWYNSEDVDEKEKIVMNYIKKQLG